MSKADKVKSVIKLYCLPEMNEHQLQQLHKVVVETALTALDGFNVKSEQDMLVLFPPDSMKYGLGSEVLVEVDLPMHPAVRGENLLPEIAEKFGKTVKKFLPKDTFVQCTPYRFDPANSWTS